MPGGHTVVIKKHPCMPNQLLSSGLVLGMCQVPCADSAICVGVPECALISSTMQWLPAILFLPLADLPVVVVWL